VVDADPQAVALGESGGDDGAVGGGQDEGADRGGEVDAGV
jgi:hypothetical protein